MFIKRRIDGTIRLSRYREFLWFVIITTFLGAASSGGFFGIRLVTALVANWLAVAFIFMINDVEDAEDDALSLHKATRNPVASGMLSYRSAWWASALVAILAGLLFLLLGIGSALWGWIGLLLGYLYSWKKIRLKNFPLLDVLSHSMMLAGCQYLTAFCAFSPRLHWWWPITFCMPVSISMYGELFNELRDFHKDREAGLTHTAAILGYRRTMAVMHTLLGVGIVSTIFTLLVIGLVPFWVLMVTLGLLICLMIPAILRIARGVRGTIGIHAPLQKPFEISFALSLSVWYLIPWISARISQWIPRWIFGYSLW